MEESFGIKHVQELFDQYIEHVDFREIVEAPYKRAIKEAKSTWGAQIAEAKSNEGAAKSRLAWAAKEAKYAGLFEGKARRLLEGGYVEVQKPKLVVTVTDLRALLKSDLADILIKSVVLDQALALAALDKRPIEGLDIETKEPVVKVSIGR